MGHKGFTLIELILVIAILGILAVSAFPQIFSLTDEATTAAEEGVVANVLSGITMLGAYKMATTHHEGYPDSLDNAPYPRPCGKANPCFINVTKDGVSDGNWKKDASKIYLGPTGSAYVYDSIVGSFTKL